MKIFDRCAVQYIERRPTTTTNNNNNNFSSSTETCYVTFFQPRYPPTFGGAAFYSSCYLKTNWQRRF